MSDKVSIYIDPELLARVDRQADVEERSRSQVVRRALEAALPPAPGARAASDPRSARQAKLNAAKAKR